MGRGYLHPEVSLSGCLPGTCRHRSGSCSGSRATASETCGTGRLWTPGRSNHSPALQTGSVHLIPSLGRRGFSELSRSRKPRRVSQGRVPSRRRRLAVIHCRAVWRSPLSALAGACDFHHDACSPGQLSNASDRGGTACSRSEWSLQGPKPLLARVLAWLSGPSFRRTDAV